MTDGALADLLGPWFGTGPERGLALIFIVAAIVGLIVTLIALRSRPYRTLSGRYMAAPVEPDGATEAPSGAPSAAT